MSLLAWARRPALLVCLLFLCCVSNASAQTTDILLPVREGNAVIGEIRVKVSEEPSDFSVDTAQLLVLLDSIATSELLADIADIEGAYLDSHMLESVGIDAALDLARAEIVLRLPGDHKKTRALAVTSPPRKASPISSNAIAPAAYSGFLNAELDLRENFDDVDTEFRDNALYLDGAFFIDPLYDVTVTSEARIDLDGSVHRDHTTATFEDDEGNWIARVGDHTMPRIGLIEDQDMLGVQFTNRLPQRLRRDNFVDRRKFDTPTITIDQSSTARVFVNDVERRSFRLDPGTYDLTGIPLSSGANDIRIEIEKADGSTERVELGQYFDRSLLAEGELEYGIGAGIAARTSLDGVEYLDDPIIGGFAEYGLQSDLSVGGAVLVSEPLSVGTGTFQWGSSLGRIEGSVAASISEDAGMGTALGARFVKDLELPTLFPGKVNFSFDLSHEQSGFRGSIGSARNDEDRWRFSSFASMNVGRGWFARASYTHFDADLDSETFALDINKHFDRWELRTGLRHRQLDRNSETSGFLSLHFDLSDRSKTTIRYDSNPDKLTARYFHRSDKKGVGSWGYNFGSTLDEERGLKPTGFAQYTGNRFRISGGAGARQANLSVASSIAFADGAISVGRPIQDSFVIVNPFDVVDQGEFNLSRTASSDTVEASSGVVLPTAIVAVGTSRTRSRSVWFEPLVEDSDFQLGAGERLELAPGIGLGYLATVDTDQRVTVLGTLLDETGDLAALVSGEIVDASGKRLDEFFTDSNGRFGAVLPEGVATIQVGKQSARIFIQENKEGFLEVGHIQLGKP